MTQTTSIITGRMAPLMNASTAVFVVLIGEPYHAA